MVRTVCVCVIVGFDASVATADGREEAQSNDRRMEIDRSIDRASGGAGEESTDGVSRTVPMVAGGVRTLSRAPSRHFHVGGRRTNDRGQEPLRQLLRTTEARRGSPRRRHSGLGWVVSPFPPHAGHTFHYIAPWLRLPFREHRIHAISPGSRTMWAPSCSPKWDGSRERPWVVGVELRATRRRG